MKKLYATRAYLLYLLGCTIFVDKTGSLVSIEWLQFLENVDTIGEYAWGTACLCFLYRALSKASKATTAQLNGYLTLFQAWIYEHFPSFNPTFRPQFEGYLANRWVYPKNSTTSVERARHLRLMLDELKPDEVIWDPYFELRDRFPMPESAWFSGMLCCLDFLQPHHPDRVLRQFSRVQQIPGCPYMSETMAKQYMAKRYRSRDNSEMSFVPFHDRLFDRWDKCCLDAEARSTPVLDGHPDTSSAYMDWFRERTLTRLSTTQASRPHAPRSKAARPPQDDGTDPPQSRDMKIFDMVKGTLANVRQMDVSDAHSAMWSTLNEILALFDETPSTVLPSSSAPTPTSSPPPPSAPSSTVAPPADQPRKVFRRRTTMKK
ncbi:PREDICTED: serine/threonine-protein phosphatase 7 long form homolog [Erythranthe guttata]|uniref:serine/threonine-protein phosphatase 7 long form homolog n=1 Tax=Erythranthe guttata TaxID=4155 RepID=UPI00064DAACC|nr:PREDICTED: serine/threonine-protein phosphatase 7 long form homolog [Erythranthe guttata]|eukprot:XP_012828547.1 PREDICTED: serine/threonine-protein phosphatase 7 long form homolog [Erythranthe guttata]